ncbi:hypothetical protein Ahy_B04g071113 [Arachis hypogaea]|uniref:Uncharacterized protein n=1 Tax=Arachis hypogaea TaxID=3818 RepID=A0A444ZK32_ARAHY|nr:hypothetical protein Ahy_B04g071113 [Arachis hypogaea]
MNITCPQPPQSLPPLQPRSPRISPRSSPQPPQPRIPAAAQPPQPLHRHSLHRHRRRSVAVVGSCVAVIGSSLAVVWKLVGRLLCSSGLLLSLCRRCVRALSFALQQRPSSSQPIIPKGKSFFKSYFFLVCEELSIVSEVEDEFTKRLLSLDEIAVFPRRPANIAASFNRFARSAPLSYQALEPATLVPLQLLKSSGTKCIMVSVLKRNLNWRMFELKFSLKPSKLSSSPHGGLSSSPPVGSMPKSFPPFQHPSNQLLEENGFQQQKYVKYHKRCLNDRKKLGIGCSEVMMLLLNKHWIQLMSFNRDEFYYRPTEPLGWWAGGIILGGRDELGGGTWLGSTRDGRVAFLTNFREVERLSKILFIYTKKNPLSRDSFLMNGYALNTGRAAQGMPINSWICEF